MRFRRMIIAVCLPRFFVTAHLLEAVPQKLSDEVLSRLESSLAARAAGGSWAGGLEDMLMRQAHRGSIQ